MPDPFPDSHDEPAAPAEGLTLGKADAGALDALVDAGFSANGDADPRVRAIADLLQTLEPDPGLCAPDRSLVDVTVARVRRAGDASSHADAPGALVGADAAAVDALVACEWDDDALPPRHARRGRRAARLLHALRPASLEATGDDDLVERTVQRVRLAAASRLDRVSLPAPGFRMPDLVAVAAMLLIGLSILWPTVGALRFDAMQAACQTGLANAGVGFALYGADHQGRLPAREGSIPAALPGAGAWWEVGSPGHSHSANLFVLVKQGYVDQRDLACEGNHFAPIGLDTHRHDDWRSPEEVSYSYQLFSPDQPRAMIGSRTVLLTDRSPLVLRAILHEAADPESRSPNHGGTGQNVLFGDRTVRWLIRPETPWGDNFWLPRGLSTGAPVLLNGTETPADADDAFVGP